MIHSVHVLFLPEHPSCLASYLPLNGSFLGQWGIVSGFEVSVQDVSMAAVPPSAPFRCEFFFFRFFRPRAGAKRGNGDLDIKKWWFTGVYCGYSIYRCYQTCGVLDLTF